MSAKGYGAEFKFLQGSFVRGLKRGMTAPVSFSYTLSGEVDLPKVVSVEIRRFSSQPASDAAASTQDWKRVGQAIGKAIDTYGRETSAGFTVAKGSTGGKRARGAEHSRRVAVAK